MCNINLNKLNLRLALSTSSYRVIRDSRNFLLGDRCNEGVRLLDVCVELNNFVYKGDVVRCEEVIKSDVLKLKSNIMAECFNNYVKFILENVFADSEDNDEPGWELSYYRRLVNHFSGQHDLYLEGDIQYRHLGLGSLYMTGSYLRSMFIMGDTVLQSNYRNGKIGEYNLKDVLPDLDPISIIFELYSSLHKYYHYYGKDSDNPIGFYIPGFNENGELGNVLNVNEFVSQLDHYVIYGTHKPKSILAKGEYDLGYDIV